MTSWFSYDLLETVTQPGGRTTSYNYPWETIEGVNGTSPLLAWTEVTDPEGRVTIVAQDVRDVTRFHIDKPAPRVDEDGDPVPPPPDLQTEYVVNSLGELLDGRRLDGAASTLRVRPRRPADQRDDAQRRHRPDHLRPRRPRAGDRSTTPWPPSGEQTTYGYEFNRLTEIDHPGTVDDVTYEYGLDNSDGRFTAGRIRHIEDRTRLVDNTYDKNGAMVEQTAIIKRHNWTPDLTGDELDPFTYTTKWTYDDLGRIATVGYPDGKTVSFVPDGTSVGSPDVTEPAEHAAPDRRPRRRGRQLRLRLGWRAPQRSAVPRKASSSVTENITPDAEGNPVTIQVPRRTTHQYAVPERPGVRPAPDGRSATRWATGRSRSTRSTPRRAGSTRRRPPHPTRTRRSPPGSRSRTSATPTTPSVAR